MNIYTIRKCTGGAILACACAALIGYCSGAPVQRPTDVGWQSDHSFRVRAAGTPDAGEKNPVARKVQAKRAAETMARFIVLEDFTAQVYSTIDEGVMAHGEVMARVRKNFGRYISSGSVVSEKYGGDGSCAIIYEIKSTHLKQSLAKLRNQISVRR